MLEIFNAARHAHPIARTQLILLWVAQRLWYALGIGEAPGEIWARKIVMRRGYRKRKFFKKHVISFVSAEVYGREKGTYVEEKDVCRDLWKEGFASFIKYTSAFTVS